MSGFRWFKFVRVRDDMQRRLVGCVEGVISSLSCKRHRVGAAEGERLGRTPGLAVKRNRGKSR